MMTSGDEAEQTKSEQPDEDVKAQTDLPKTAIRLAQRIKQMRYKLKQNQHPQMAKRPQILIQNQVPIAMS